jgi:hypothetical protein
MGTPLPSEPTGEPGRGVHLPATLIDRWRALETEHLSMGTLLREPGGEGGGCFIWDHEGCVKEALKMGLTSGALLGKLERGSFTRGLERQKEEGSFTGDSEGYAKQGSGNGCLSP